MEIHGKSLLCDKKKITGEIISLKEWSQEKYLSFSAGVQPRSILHSGQ
jgi:hypothetical protein